VKKTKTSGHNGETPNLKSQSTAIILHLYHSCGFC